MDNAAGYSFQKRHPGNAFPAFIQHILAPLERMEDRLKYIHRSSFRRVSAAMFNKYVYKPLFTSPSFKRYASLRRKAAGAHGTKI